MRKPSEFIEAYDRIAAAKAALPPWKLLLLGMLAGFFIGCGALISSVGSFAVENASLARVAAGCLFPMGLIMVILTGAELFTGNCLLTIALLRGRVSWRGVLKNLLFVYCGNLLGALLLAAACAAAGVYSLGGGALAAYAVSAAAGKCALGFGTALIRGILCNILVCAAVMFALSADSLGGKALGAFVPVAVFVIGGFEHCVANMYYIPLAMLLDSSVTLAGFLHNLIPVTLGNILGGCGFAALMAACHSAPKRTISSADRREELSR